MHNFNMLLAIQLANSILPPQTQTSLLPQFIYIGSDFMNLYTRIDIILYSFFIIEFIIKYSFSLMELLCDWKAENITTNKQKHNQQQKIREWKAY